MSTKSQRVVVIQDASREVSFSAITWAQHGLLLKPGDKLILLGVLHQVNTPMGYRSKVDTSSMFGANQKVIDEEVVRKKKEYLNNMELKKITNHYAEEKIIFEIEVIAGPSPKMIALQASKNLKATWVILDRHLKNDKKYFMERLSCGISRMKRDNSIEKLRGPKVKGSHKVNTEGNETNLVTYDEMVPGSPEEDDLFSLEMSPRKSPTLTDEEQGVNTGEGHSRNSTSKMTSFSKSKSSEYLVLTKVASSSSLGNTEASSSSLKEATIYPSSLQEEEHNINIQQKTEKVGSSNSIYNRQEMGQREGKEIGSQDQDRKGKTLSELEPMTIGLAGWEIDEKIENSICPICKNRRPNFGWKRDFSYAELQAATNGFSKKNFLSEGGFGSVYKGKLKDGPDIAVKQLKDASLQGEKEFKAEVHVLSKARHSNVVMLLGSCSEGSHRLLVYEYVCNGSLDQHLSQDTKKPLRWENRMKIALGAARGLNYLHENNIIHRDMRPNNILITHDHEPLLGDFGLARTQHAGSDHSSETRVVGTFGYLAPEYAESGKVSTKTDVYSYGVVLLQLITGLRTTDKKLGEKSLVAWARPLLKERKYPDLIDNKLVDSHDVLQLFWMVRVAKNCLSKDPDKRLSMKKVVYALTYLTRGETVSGIKELFPTNYDSASGVPESCSSQQDEETVEQESVTTEVSSVSSANGMSELFSSASSAQTFSTRSSTSSEISLSVGGKNDKKEKVKSRNRTQVPYGEMLH